MSKNIDGVTPPPPPAEPPSIDVWCDWCTETHLREEHITGPKSESKLTQIVINKLKEAFLIDATVRQACFLSGISLQTYYNWKERHPKLFDQLEEFKEDTKIKAKETVRRGVKKDPKLALDYLSRVDKETYSTRQELTGKDGGAIETKAVEVMDVGEATTSDDEDKPEAEPNS